MRDTTVAIILGGSDFHKAELTSDPAFKVSANAIADYLYRPDGFGLDSDNLLDLFDDPRSPGEIDNAIRDFLEDRSSVLLAQGDEIRNLIVYYTGHGHFAPPDDIYVLALPFTHEANVRSTAYHVVNLATTIKRSARRARRIILLDCCFAASAYSAFQSGGLDAVEKQTRDAFARSGTSLLCASAPDRPAKSRTIAGRTESGMTLFSEALVSVLNKGIAYIDRQLLTLAEVGIAVQDTVIERFDDEGPRPQIKSPDERSGDISAIPLFPNAARAQTAPSKKSRPVESGLKFTQPSDVTSNDPVIIAIEDSNDRIPEDMLLGVERHITVTLDPQQISELEDIAKRLSQETLEIEEIKSFGLDAWMILVEAQDWLNIVIENAERSDRPQPVAWTGKGGLLARIYQTIQIACRDEEMGIDGFVSLRCGSFCFMPLVESEIPRSMQKRHGSLDKVRLSVKAVNIDKAVENDQLGKLAEIAGNEVVLLEAADLHPPLERLTGLIRGDSTTRVVVGFGDFVPSAEALNALLTRLPALTLGNAGLATSQLQRALRRHLPATLPLQSVATALQPFRIQLLNHAHAANDAKTLFNALCWTTWTWIGRPLFSTGFGEALPAAFPHLMNLRSIASKDWYFDRSSGIPPIYKAESLINSGGDPERQFHMYLTGAGGTGKSCFLRYVYETLEVNQPEILPVWYKVDAPSSEWSNVERRIKEEVRRALLGRFDTNVVEDLIDERKNLPFFLTELVSKLRERDLSAVQVVLFIDQLERTFESGESPELYRLERISKKFIEMLEAVGVGQGIRVFIASRKQYLPDFLGSSQKASQNNLHFNVLQKITSDTEQVEFVQRILGWCKENNLVDRYLRLDEQASKELAGAVDGHPLEIMLALIHVFSQSPAGQISKEDIELMSPWEKLFSADEQLAAKDEIDWYFFLAMAHARTEIVRFEEVWWRIRLVSPGLTKRVEELGPQGVLERMWLQGHLGRTVYPRPLDDNPARFLEFFHANMRDHLISAVMNYGGEETDRRGRKGGTPSVWRALDRLIPAARDWKQSQQLMLREDINVLMQHKEVFVELVSKEDRAEQVEALYLLFLRDNKDIRDDLFEAARECFVYSALVHDVLGRWAFGRLYPNIGDRIKRCEAWLKRCDAVSRIRLLQYLVELRDARAEELLCSLIISERDEVEGLWQQLAAIFAEPLYAARFRRTFVRSLINYLQGSNIEFPQDNAATERFGEFVVAACEGDREELLSLIDAFAEDVAFLQDDKLKLIVKELLENQDRIDAWLKAGAGQAIDLSTASRETDDHIPPRIELRTGDMLRNWCTEERLSRWHEHISGLLGLPIPEFVLTRGELVSENARSPVQPTVTASEFSTGHELQLLIDGRLIALGDFFPGQLQALKRHWDIDQLDPPAESVPVQNEALEECVVWFDAAKLAEDQMPQSTQDCDEAALDWLHRSLRKNVHIVFSFYDLMPFITSLSGTVDTRFDLRELLRTVAGNFPALWRVLINLAREYVPLRNNQVELILELQQLVRKTRQTNTAFLTQKLREHAGLSICRVFTDSSNQLPVLLMDADLEQQLIARLQIAEDRHTFRVTVDEGMRVASAVRDAFQNAVLTENTVPVLVCEDNLRLPMYRLIQHFDSRINVLSYTELSPEIRPVSRGIVSGVSIAPEPTVDDHAAA